MSTHPVRSLAAPVRAAADTPSSASVAPAAAPVSRHPDHPPAAAVDHRLPKTKPSDPNFSSGPCTKFPGWSLDKLADAIDPGGDVGESVRELKDSMDKDAATDDIKEIGKMAGKAGQDIADDAKSDEPADTAAEDAGNKSAVKES